MCEVRDEWQNGNSLDIDGDLSAFARRFRLENVPQVLQDSDVARYRWIVLPQRRRQVLLLRARQKFIILAAERAEALGNE